MNRISCFERNKLNSNLVKVTMIKEVDEVKINKRSSMVLTRLCDENNITHSCSVAIS